MTSSIPPAVEKKSSTCRYGREEMLTMYAPALPIPEDLRDMTIFCMRELLPMSFLPVTEDEQAALLKCVNSDVAIRSTQRASSQPQGARSAPGEQKRGRGRGRGTGADASLRNNSKSNDARSETSESLCSADWRKEKSAAEMPGDGPYERGTTVARPLSKSESSESSGGNYESDASQEVQAVQCSDRLSNTAAATSPSEDVNIKMASARDRCVVANSINRVIQYNANSELLDRRKQDPTSASSYDNVISNNATSSNRNHVVDLRPSQLVPSADSKHCGGDAQHLSVNLSVGNMVDTSLLSAYGGGFCGDVTRAGIKSDGVVWCDPLCSRASDVVENAPRKGFSTADAAATEMWFYKDPNGEIQGPFRSREMEEWFLMGYFPMKLLVRRGRTEDFVLLGDLIKVSGRVPFLSRTEEREVPLSRDQSTSADQTSNLQSRPASVLSFHQQFVPSSTAFSVPSFFPETVVTPPLHDQRMERCLSSAASVASRDSGWPFNSRGGLSSQIEGSPFVGVDRERIEDDLKKRIEKQLKEKLMIEMEREKLRQEQLKIEEERRLMIEHHRLLEDERKRQDERRKMEDERRHLEEERRKLKDLHRKAEEDRRKQERLRMEIQQEEQEMRKIEEERKLLARERLELKALHEKAEGDRQALQLLQDLSDDSYDEGTAVSDGAREEERFRGRMWSTWKAANNSGGGWQGESAGHHDEGQGERRESCPGSDKREPAREQNMAVVASEGFGEEMHQPNEELNCVEKSVSSRSVHEMKMKLVPWNSSSGSDAEKQCTPTSPVVKCPWATQSVPSIVSSQPSAEARDVGQEKDEELWANSEAQRKRLDMIQQQKKQMSFSWKEQKGLEESAQSTNVKSFLEIQKEQEMEEQKKRKQQQQQSCKGTVTGSKRPPRLTKAATPAVVKVDPPASSSGRSLLGAPSVPGLMSVLVAPAPVPFAPLPWNQLKVPPMSPAAEMNEFMVWCHRALPTTNSSVDASTLIDFLKDVESPYELYDYVRLYLGESKQSTDFAHEFLERRKRLQMRLNRATILGYQVTPVFPSIAFGYQTTGMFYQPHNGNLTLQPNKVKGQKMML